MSEIPAQASTDHGTVLPPRSAALIWSPGEGWQLLVPDYGDDESVPAQVLALTALMIKFREPEAVQELADEFEEMARSVS